MNKIRNLISALLGLVALAALVVGLAWLLGAQGALPAQQAAPARPVSPLRTPTPLGYEPTAPSEDWPTLAPPPTWVMPTPQGTPVVKPGEPPTPMPTPLPPLPLPPIPEGEPPADLWSILYLPLEDKLAVYGVLVDTQGRRWSDPQVVYDFRQVAGIDAGSGWILTDLKTAPTGDWLAVVVSYYESGQVWLLDLSSREARPVPACEEYLGCGVRDWSPDGRAVILELYPFGDHPSEYAMVDVATDTASGLHVPETTLKYSSVGDATFSPDGRSIVWTVGGAGDHGETTEVWLTDSKGEQARLLISEPGLIWDVSLSPDGSQIAYSYAAERQQKAGVRLLSVERRESMSPVLAPDSFISNPVWSPDGLRVAMTRCADAPSETNLADYRCSVSVLDRRTGLVTPVVTFPGGLYWDVSWSPDGRLLAFVSVTGDSAWTGEGLYSLWLLSPETGTSYPVSGYMRPYSEYAWLPSGLVSGR